MTGGVNSNFLRVAVIPGIYTPRAVRAVTNRASPKASARLRDALAGPARARMLRRSRKKGSQPIVRKRVPRHSSPRRTNPVGESVAEPAAHTESRRIDRTMKGKSVWPHTIELSRPRDVTRDLDRAGESVLRDSSRSARRDDSQKQLGLAVCLEVFGVHSSAGAAAAAAIAEDDEVAALPLALY